VTIVDQSANGTRVGSAHVHAAAIRVAKTEVLKIGPYSLRFALQLEDDPAAAAERKRRIHRTLLDHMNLPALDLEQVRSERMRKRVVDALERVIAELEGDLLDSSERERLVSEMVDEVLGLGPLQTLLDDDDVSEIMVVDPATIYVERRGKLELTPLRFIDDESCRAVIERMVTPIGRRIDESAPLVDARLSDGSRVNAAIPPIAVRGPCITIRKFGRDRLSMKDLVAAGALTSRMAAFLARCVRARKNLIISGGTGTGKTTLLNILSAEIPAEERIVTIEDAAELQLAQPHVVSLESKPINMEGKGAYTIRDLVKNALRMRPDRIVVGECRGGEAIDMLQAMNTGHEGSMTTTHANSVREAVKRLETLCMMSGLELPTRAIREQMASSLHVVVQQARFSDGSRRVVSIAEVGALDERGELGIHEIFQFARLETSEGGQVKGEHRPTGYVPTFLDEFIRRGVMEHGGYL
jgi:pilus assembly protein CpaF